MSTEGSRHAADLARKWCMTMVDVRKMHSPYKSVYKNHQEAFTTLANFAAKCNMDAKRYILFCITELNVMKPEDLLVKVNILRFVESLKRDETYTNIKNRYVESAMNLADDAIAEGFTSAERYIAHLFETNRIAQVFLSGRISKHFLASIQNFGVLFGRLNTMNQDTLRTVFDVFDGLNQEAQESFSVTGCDFMRPVAFTDQVIKTKTKNQKEKTERE